MQIKQLNKSVYAGRKFTARYFTDGYYDIRQTESGFNIAYTPFEKTLEKSLDYEFFEEWLEDPVAFGAFDGENLLGFVEGSVEEWNNRFRISSICVFDELRRGEGIGNALIETIIETAKSSGARMAVLETQTCNERAIAFYKKHGFPLSDSTFTHIQTTTRNAAKCA